MYTHALDIDIKSTEGEHFCVPLSSAFLEHFSIIESLSIFHFSSSRKVLLVPIRWIRAAADDPHPKQQKTANASTRNKFEHALKFLSHSNHWLSVKRRDSNLQIAPSMESFSSFSNQPFHDDSHDYVSIIFILMMEKRFSLRSQPSVRSGKLESAVGDDIFPSQLSHFHTQTIFLRSTFSTQFFFNQDGKFLLFFLPAPILKIDRKLRIHSGSPVALKTDERGTENFASIYITWQAVADN